MSEKHDSYARVKAEVPRNVQFLEDAGYRWNNAFAWFEKTHAVGLVWTIEGHEAGQPFEQLRELVELGGTLKNSRV